MLTDDKEFIKVIGIQLRKMRVEAGFSSYEQFAFEHDLDRRYYWSIENGTNISVKYLFKILRIHGVTFSEFFEAID